MLIGTRKVERKNNKLIASTTGISGPGRAINAASAPAASRPTFDATSLREHSKMLLNAANGVSLEAVVATTEVKIHASATDSF
ncbi:hypothetical protein FHR20_001581 [Sphingomonas leidyi]|uniref:Uncharacterized protein n=1 Tax=Sphingomonas leidyi TaxID=68569 RepID=A0A7X5ZV13_9SPHN|nr:hypothetical protein [Sphingomonas leidyi]NIJ64650.1 hypothetical protein [Sphingomonas leidyi]